MEKNIEEKKAENISFISKSEQFIEKNAKIIGWVLGAILLVVVAFFGLRKFVFEPRIEKANEAIFVAEQQLANGDFQSALYGDSTSIVFDNKIHYSIGFLKVIDKYGSTKVGKRAKYEAGICFMRLGKYEEALKYLGKYNGKDQLTPVMNEMLKGDAEAELGNNSAAIKHYNKAAKMDENPITAPFALFKAGVVYLVDNDYDNAVKCFQTVKEKYPESTLFSEMDGFIAYAEASKK